ncbi:MAG: PhzF family phenazine biosynthesis protein [Pseudoxanthomonas sp.]
MTVRRFLQVDVFSTAPGTGNPLAVVLDAQGLSDAQMQAIARWTKLPETTFVLPGSGAHAYAIRMFAPHREVPFAGHPSIGTAHVVLEAGLAAPRDGVLVQEGIAGAFPIAVEDGAVLSLRTPPAQVAEVASFGDPRLSRAVSGWAPGALPPALVDGGRRWWLVEVASEAALRALAPDWDAIAALAEATASMGVFAFARADAPADFDLAVRAFVGSGRRFEDAASGAANALLAAWLHERGVLPGRAGRYRASQGREVGFDARLQLRVDGAGRVWSGGRVRTLVRGTLDWDA